MQRQIHYACIDVSKAAWVKDPIASDDITLGLDHRGVKVILEVPCRSTALSRKQARSAVNWQPEDKEK